MSRRIALLAKWPLLALLFAALCWGSWYVYDKGFGKRWRWTLAKEFERYGLVITARRLTLDPFHGLIAERSRSSILKAGRRSWPKSAISRSILTMRTCSSMRPRSTPWICAALGFRYRSIPRIRTEKG